MYRDDDLMIEEDGINTKVSSLTQSYQKGKFGLSQTITYSGTGIKTNKSSEKIVMPALQEFQEDSSFEGGKYNDLINNSIQKSGEFGKEQIWVKESP